MHRCEGINVFLADGEAAFQEVFHFHLHVFPRYAGDGFSINAAWKERDRTLLDADAGAIKGALALAALPPEDLPIAEFGFPGPLRDQLVTAILSGTKTTTTGLVADYELEGEPLPRPGLRQAVVDSVGNRVAVIETTAVRVIRLGDVDLAHALGEGDGYRSVAEWRAGHEHFWHSAAMRAALGDPEFTVSNDTLVVAQTFRLLQP